MFTKLSIAACLVGALTSQALAEEPSISKLEKCAWSAASGSTEISEVKVCLDAFESARNAGIAGSQLMKVSDDYAGPIAKEERVSYGWDRYAKVSDARAFVLGVFIDKAAGQVEGMVSAAQRWLDEVDERGPQMKTHRIMAARAPIANCRKVIAKALAAGVPGDIKIKAEKRIVALGQADALVCSKLESELDKLAKLDKARTKAKRAATLAPYKKALKGTRFVVFERKELWDLEVRGIGGKLLNSPRKLARARAWFVISNPPRDSRGRASWRVRGYFFRGNKLAKKTEKTGLGRTPPANAYR